MVIDQGRTRAGDLVVTMTCGSSVILTSLATTDSWERVSYSGSGDLVVTMT